MPDQQQTERVQPILRAANDNDVLMMQRRSIGDLTWSRVTLTNFRIVPASVYLGWTGE
jgi:hypothetical protein